MAEYYVDGVNGDDSNSGTSKDQAWKTIAKAMNTLTAGDICHIRPGVYRQTATLTPANSGNATDGYIEYIGDVNGEIWGEKGDVIITNVNSTNDGTNYNGHLINLDTNSNAYLKFKNIIFLLGNTATARYYILYKSNTNDGYIWLVNCKLLSAFNMYYVIGIGPNFSKGYVIRTSFFSFYKCIDTSGSSNYLYIENNIFLTRYYAVFDNGGTSSYVFVYNNLFIEGGYTINYVSGTGCEAKNNLFIGSFYPFHNGTPPIIENNYAIATYDSSNVTSVGLNYDLILNLKKDLDSIFDVGSNVIFQGGNLDINNNPRKLGTGIDVGPVEYNPPEEKEATEVRAGSYSLKLTNASFQDIKTFLPAGSYTISVYTKWSGYSGTDKPQLIVKQDKYCGINSDQIVTATGDGTSWEQLSVNITLTKDAEITIRLYARDTGSSAVTYFDDLDIS